MLVNLLGDCPYPLHEICINWKWTGQASKVYVNSIGHPERQSIVNILRKLGVDDLDEWKRG